MTILITGATGLVGERLVPRLVEAGLSCRVLLRAGKPSPLGATAVTGDILDPLTLSDAVRGISAVVHLAAVFRTQDTDLIWKSNLEGTRNLIAAVKADAPDARFIMSSTSNVYNIDNPHPGREEDPALCLNREIRGRGFFRGVFFFPVMLSPVVVALTWQWILQRNGALNGLMTWVGLTPVNWLVFPNTAFFWSVFITVWAHMGFYTIILLAGLQAIPKDVYEAAKMDSANNWRVFSRITLPMLKPMLLVVFVLCVIRSVQTFDELYVLTGGGPGSATMLMVQYIYEIGFAVQPRNFGLAAAASLLLGIVLLIFTGVQLRLSRSAQQ
jgi:ABC-type spermidine/putrescine transport system permease subunit I